MNESFVICFGTQKRLYPYLYGNEDKSAKNVCIHSYIYKLAENLCNDAKVGKIPVVLQLFSPLSK